MTEKSVKIKLDFPNLDQGGAGIYPREFDASAGYLVVIANRIDGKISMSYVVGRVSASDEDQKVMDKLQAIVRRITTEFRKELEL